MNAFYFSLIWMILFPICSTSQAGLLSATLIEDIEVTDADRDGDFNLVEVEGPDLDITTRPPESGVRRGALEFHLPSLPSGMTIDSVLLSLSISHGSDNPQLEIHGYVGDGVPLRSRGAKKSRLHASEG